jgi:hypothetical protein
VAGPPPPHFVPHHTRSVLWSRPTAGSRFWWRLHTVAKVCCARRHFNGDFSVALPQVGRHTNVSLSRVWSQVGCMLCMPTWPRGLRGCAQREEESWVVVSRRQRTDRIPRSFSAVDPPLAPVQSTHMTPPKATRWLADVVSTLYFPGEAPKWHLVPKPNCVLVALFPPPI